MTTQAEKDRISAVCAQLYQASREIRILSHISWGEQVRNTFFAKGARELPQVEYPQFDASPTLQRVEQARRSIQSSEIDQWLLRQASVLETSARMLAKCGTADYFKYASDLYGTPTQVLPDGASTAFGLATKFDRLVGTFDGVDLGAPPLACHLAHVVVENMTTAVTAMFGKDAPLVQVVDDLSANALAGPRRIRVRRSACFTDKDINQLIQHEAFVHVATSLNGLAQTDLKILGAGHPGTTKTQEGLAVFAEFVTGTIDIDRMRRLGDRVLAIQMAIEGADFIEVYRYFETRTGNEQQAFENARRVFRGGVLAGGAPFTKDLVYLDGLLRVHNFLRVIVSTGRSDCLRLLFCGKLDIEDIPVLYDLTKMGLCRAPKYLPPWAADLRFLLCYLSYSSLLNDIDLQRVTTHYDELLERIPKAAASM